MRPPGQSPGSRGSRSADAPSPAETGLEALDWAVSAGTAAEVLRLAAVRRRRRTNRRLAGGVALCAVLAAAGWIAPRFSSSAAHAVASPRDNTRVVAPETQTLSDGTVVELRPGTEIAHDYRPGLRRVVLRAGEAHFQVSKDPARPFVVVAAGIEVRAVGTAFSVDLRPAVVDVVVTEGRVAVAGAPASAPGDAASLAALVGAGEQAIVPRDAAHAAAVRPLSPVDQRLRLGWRTPLFEFSATPLREVIDHFNRAGSHRLSLGRGLGHLRVSGVMRSDDLDSLLTLLKNEFGITASESPDGALALRR